MTKGLIASLCLFALLAVPISNLAQVIPVIPFMGMGDSIAEGVQSADANFMTQPFSFVNMIAIKANLPIPLPLILTSPFGVVGNTAGRSRITPFQHPLNLGVSGATVNGVINDPQDAVDPSLFNSETDLVLFPFAGSQLQIVEFLRPLNLAVSVGTADVSGAITSVDNLNASQMTPIDAFRRDYNSLSSRLRATGAHVIVNTIPDITQLGFLLSHDDVNAILGSTFGMPVDNKTTLIGVLLIVLGQAPPSVLSDPNFLLDPSEIARIQTHIAALNRIINVAANDNGFAVADLAGKFNAMSQGVLLNDVFGLSLRFLGGLLSLDAIHPSNTGYAMIANEYIAAFNSKFDPKVPEITDPEFMAILSTDPFVDLNHNNRVPGRPGFGMLETVMFQIGVTGDNEAALTAARVRGIDRALAERVASVFLQSNGIDLRTAGLRARINAFKEAFGLGPYQPK